MKQIKYRRALSKDALNLWKLKNSDVVRKNAINQEVILFPDHVRWFEASLKNPNVKIYIIETPRGHFIGDLRISYGEISIRITERYRGMGIGSKAIKKFAAVGMTAQILRHNEASLHVFSENGFNFVEEKGDILILKK